MLSILIPVYNYDVTALMQNLHEQCSALNIPFEIVLADDKSEAVYVETNKNQAGLLNCRFIENDINKGRTQTRKLLAETAIYNNLLFLDSDVLPASDTFIKNYLEVIDKAPVVFGGISYKNEPKNPETILRLKYGLKRESKQAKVRNKKQYSNIFSANLLIKKQLFLENNFSETSNLYGLDNYLSYELYRKNIPVLHIDNDVYHIGIEPNDIFFNKSLDSVKIRKQLLADKEGIGNINSLLKHYNYLKKYKLIPIASFTFKVFEPLLKNRIFSKNPNLFCLDLYRLGYICSI